MVFSSLPFRRVTAGLRAEREDWGARDSEVPTGRECRAGGQAGKKGATRGPDRVY